MVHYVSSTDEEQAAVLNPAAIPDPGDFAVEADGEPVTVNAVEVAADQGLVRLTLASAVRAEQSVTLTYTPGETPIANVWGKPAGAFTNIPVHNATSSSEALFNDATLSTFRLADIAFDTPFTAQRTQYSAEVEHGTGEVKIDARPTQAAATVEYLDGAGEPIADADPDAAGMQAALEVGRERHRGAGHRAGRDDDTPVRGDSRARAMGADRRTARRGARERHQGARRAGPVPGRHDVQRAGHARTRECEKRANLQHRERSRGRGRQGPSETTRPDGM